MITVASYVDVDSGTSISYEVCVLDEHVDLVIGSELGLSSSLHLVLSEPEMFTKLARVLVQAGDELVGALRERDEELRAQVATSGG